MKPTPARTRRGFAMIMAMLCLPLAVAAIETVASLVTADIQQTHDAIVQAQVEQLLFAGGVAAHHNVSASLPALLRAAGAHLDIEHDAQSVRISASLEHASQTFVVTATSPIH